MWALNTQQQTNFHKFQQCLKKANAHSVSNVNILKVISDPNTNASSVVFNYTQSFLDAVKKTMMTKLNVSMVVE
jgi:hypothetical protein